MNKLPTFAPAAKCPKCGHDDIGTIYHAGGCQTEDCHRCHVLGCIGPREEHLKRTCTRCWYSWLEAAVDAPAVDGAPGGGGSDD